MAVISLTSSRVDLARRLGLLDHMLSSGNPWLAPDLAQSQGVRRAQIFVIDVPWELANQRNGDI